MDGRILDYFICAYEERNFAQAAKRVPISPQGLIKAIRALEREINATLFDSSTGAQVPTACGDRLYVYALSHQSAYRELKTDLDSIKRSQNGVVKIGVCIGIMGALPLTLFEDFETAYPNIRLEREDVPDYICDERLQNSSYDLAFTLAPYHKEFETIELFEDSHFLWIPRTDPLANQDTIRIKDFDGKTLFWVGPEYKGHNEIKRLFDAQGIHPTKATVIGEMDWLHHLAKEAQGVSLTVRHKANLFPNDPSVTCKPIPELPWKFGLSYRKGHLLSCHERTFISYCSRALRTPCEHA